MGLFKTVSFTLLAHSAMLVSSCSSTRSNENFAIIHPESIKAHTLYLSKDDLYFFHQHNPALLKKIDQGMRLTIDDVISMHIIGLSPESMIKILDHTSSVFNLTTSDVLKLQTEGLSFKVINHMIQS